jgi:hypothetical protein
VVLSRPSAGARGGMWGWSANNFPRGTECVLEQPLVPAVNCELKFMANPSALAFATAWRVSVGQAAFSPRWPASPLPIRFPAPPPSTCASATKEPGSNSAFALSAGQRCSTPKRVTNNRLRVSPWAPLPTQPFRHRKFRSMIVADILGCNYRQGQRRMKRTPSDCAHGGQKWIVSNPSHQNALLITPPSTRSAAPWVAEAAGLQR